MDNSFEKELQKYLRQKRDEMRDEFSRVLPTGELLFNRFEKSKYLNMGENSSVYDTSVIMGDVEVGNNVWIGPYTMIEGTNEKVKIGNFVSIDAGVFIYTHDSTKYYVSGGKCPFEKGAVEIGDYSVIGSMSIVKHGVRIGKHCVVGAGSFVTKDIPDFSIVAGTPAKLIGKVVLGEKEVSFQYRTK